MFEILAFAFINFLGVMSPGPDFAIVTRYGFSGSRRAAFLATVGITMALLIHVSYCLLGVAVFLQSSKTLFGFIQMAGALYLGYVAICLVREKKGSLEEFSLKQEQKAFRVGFFTNLLNPKATLFLLSLFTQFVTPKTPSALKIIYALIIPVSAFFWFGFLSYILTHPTLFGKIQRYQWVFTRLMGVFLFGLSFYILVTASLGFL